MAEWDKFVINDSGKAIINNKKEFDILKLPSGRYFLNKEVIATKEVLTKLKSYSPDEIKKDLLYPIYKLIGITKDSKEGITTKITDKKALSTIIQEIEESLIKE